MRRERGVFSEKPLARRERAAILGRLESPHPFNAAAPTDSLTRGRNS
jgi:hypothetical protein